MRSYVDDGCCLKYAMMNLGEAFDYAKYVFDMDTFMFHFRASGYAKRFETGDTSVILAYQEQNLL